MNTPTRIAPQSLKRKRRAVENFAYASGSVSPIAKALLAAWLLASLLFAHGCHGDADHELFGILRSSVRCDSIAGHAFPPLAPDAVEPGDLDRVTVVLLLHDQNQASPARSASEE